MSRPTFRPLAAVAAGALLAAGGPLVSRAQGVDCSVYHPIAVVGPDQSTCAPTIGTTDVQLSGVLSLSNGIGGPIQQYCWTTTNGIFVESGTAQSCSIAPTVTLR